MAGDAGAAWGTSRWDVVRAAALPIALLTVGVSQLSALRARREAIRLKELLEKEERDRMAERKGRIKAEQQLRSRLISGVPADTAPAPSPGPAGGGGLEGGTQGGGPGGWPPYPLTPIGRLRSCFSMRNGTPRQPLLVPSAKALLKLRPGVPEKCFDGLDGYSHCWIIYIFDKNTDLPRLWEPQGGKVHGKVSVPRLNGGKMGVLATRSPHRPVPVGLSVAKVAGVKKGVLYLEGADVVDGTPVLDIKPYLPFCDGVPGATAPDWVAVEATDRDEPLKLGGVTFGPGAEDQLRWCWDIRASSNAGSLYPSAEAWAQFVKDVLSRDIRSVHQRLRVAPAHAPGPSPAAPPAAGAPAAPPGAAGAAPKGGGGAEGGGGGEGEGGAPGTYHVALDGSYVSYVVGGGEGGAGVEIIAARPDKGPPPE